MTIETAALPGLDPLVLPEILPEWPRVRVVRSTELSLDRIAR